MNKVRLGILLVALVGILTAGYSMAYFTGEADLTEAQFVTGVVKAAFDGVPQMNTRDESIDNRRVVWSVCNTGDNDVYLRVKPIDEEGQVTLGDGEDITIRAEGAWKTGGDDYYYYPEVVAPDECVQFALNIFFDLWSPVDLPVDIVVEAVQASNNAVCQMWPNNPFK